ncbi:hypothetical protein M3Y99_00033900 [Aphelenchoides fujianensis]|nr:hypothetical protein M3Y99_00033900 [Aphelenchoides fujianensis]
MPSKRQKRTSRIVNRPLGGEDSAAPAAKRRAEAKNDELDDEPKVPTPYLLAAVTNAEAAEEVGGRGGEPAAARVRRKRPLLLVVLNGKPAAAIDPQKLEEFLKNGGDDRAFVGRLLSSLDVRTSRIERGEIFADSPPEDLEEESKEEEKPAESSSKTPAQPKAPARPKEAAKKKKRSLTDWLKEATSSDDSDRSPPPSTSKLTDLIFSKPPPLPRRSKCGSTDRRTRSEWRRRTCPSSVNSLMNGSFRTDFKKPEVQRDFELLQAAVLGHTPGLFADFMGIMEETHKAMDLQGPLNRPLV